MLLIPHLARSKNGRVHGVLRQASHLLDSPAKVEQTVSNSYRETLRGIRLCETNFHILVDKIWILWASRMIYKLLTPKVPENSPQSVLVGDGFSPFFSQKTTDFGAAPPQNLTRWENVSWAARMTGAPRELGGAAQPWRLPNGFLADFWVSDHLKLRSNQLCWVPGQKDPLLTRHDPVRCDPKLSVNKSGWIGKTQAVAQHFDMF